MSEVRLLTRQDAQPILDYYVRNRHHLKPWIPTLPDEFYTIEYQSSRIEQYLPLERVGQEFRFVLFDEERMIASINMTAVEYGAFLNARLGYSVSADYSGQGVATSLIHHVCEFAAEQLNLHRIEANVMPRNTASARALLKNGFSKVGRSPEMVKIAGVWEDHDMYARIL